MDDTRQSSDSFICPSTKKYFQEWRASSNSSLWDFIHGYIYGRWPYTYIGVAKGRHPLAKLLGPLFRIVSSLFPKTKPDNGRITFADGYHGKVMPLDRASRLVTINKPLAMPDLEQVVPYRRARALILKNPDHIAALQCPCRAAQENPCQPDDVCLIIGEPFAAFIIAHHPDKARRITQEEAVTILEQEEERGHVHHAFFKDAMLDRFYAICNCCACCCGAMSAHRNGTPMLDSSGYVSVVDHDLCAGCSTCEAFCQFGAISMAEGQAEVDYEKCMGCGVCVSKCELGAASLQRDPGKGEPLDILTLQEGKTAPLTAA